MDSQSSTPAQKENQTAKRHRLNVDTEESKARMECILREQLDLELYLKQKEINAISDRLCHSETLLGVLGTAIQAMRFTDPSPDNMADGYMEYFRNYAEAHEQQQARNNARSLRGRPRRAAATSVRYTPDASGTLYVQSSGGETMHIICPSCQRDQFVSLQGFINHCRLRHGLEFTSHDEAVRMCGHAVSSIDNRADGVVDSDHCGSRNSSTTAPAKALGLRTLADRLNSGQLSSVTDAVDFINRPRTTEAESSDDESDSDTQSNTAQARLVSKSAAIGGSVPSSNMPVGQDSRFHVVRRVILGNSSQYVALQHRPPEKEKSTHKWTVYIHSISKEHPIDEYVRRVRVFLHPSYRPDDIVDLEPPNFELTRWGWGEFPVRLQVFFRDKRNKPVDLIHMLKLDDLWSGNVVLGSETPIDFELDRRGLELEQMAPEQHVLEAAHNLPSIVPPDNAILQQLFTYLCSICPLVLADAVPLGKQVSRSPDQILDMIPASIVDKWTWGVAVSKETWSQNWPIGKRLAAEESRNRALLSLMSRGISMFTHVSTSSTNANDTSNDVDSPKQILIAAIKAVLCACDAQDAVLDSLSNLITSSNNKVSEEAIELLRMWGSNASNARRTIAPDRSRGPQLRSFACSLKQWLRYHGFVPLPILSPEEQHVYIQPALREQKAPFSSGGTNPIPTPTSPLDGQSQEAISPERVVAEQQLEQHGALCNFCGSLTMDGHAAHTSQNNDDKAFYCSKYCEEMSSTELSTITSVGDLFATLPEGWDHTEDESDTDAMLMIDDDEKSYLTPNPIADSTSAAHEDNEGYGSSQYRIKYTASMIRAYHLKQQSERHLNRHSDGESDKDMVDDDAATDAAVGPETNCEDDEYEHGADDQAIDWIWSTIRPLELNCAPASRFTESGSTTNIVENSEPNSWVQLPNCNDEAFGEALEQRLIVGRLLLDVAKLFLRDLVSTSDGAMRRNRAACIQNSKANAETNTTAVSQHQLLMLTPLHVLSAVKRNPQLFDVCSNAYLGRKE
ncbi:hypothetical protein BX070DRAFT_225185 [Coemansia spiralis]|nr:hypothetical protein BX070DRAFT_225185 [Coemansia spiralis]